MRRALAALLLSVQLQPLWGLVLCLGVLTPATSGDEHCASVTVVAPAQGAPEVGATPNGNAPHGCPLTDACAPTVVATLLVGVPPMQAIAGAILPLKSADPALGLARLAPPTPPPDL